MSFIIGKNGKCLGQTPKIDGEFGHVYAGLEKPWEIEVYVDVAFLHREGV
jgi:hypothetical protein